VVQGDETILAAGIRQGIGLPYGCKDGACGSCKCKKLGRGHARPAPEQGAERRGRSRLRADLLRGAQSDVVLESRQVTDESAFPIRKMPVARAGLEKVSHDVMIVKLQLPANDTAALPRGPVRGVHPARRRAPQLFDGQCAAQRPTGIELHIRHMPGGKFTDHVFGAMKEKEILRVEGPFGSFFLREDSDKPMSCWPRAPASRRSRRCSSTCSSRASRGPPRCTGAAAGPGTCTWTPGCASSGRDAAPALRARDLQRLPEDNWTGRTGFVHQAVLEDFPTCRATRCMPAARPSWSTRPRDYVALAGCPPKSSTPTPSPPKPTRRCPDPTFS
jgi:CDP-4-dehydro-6-deoxyglucose reductase